MPNSSSGLHGMLLEEVLLALLRYSGYTPVDDPLQDPETLGGQVGFLKVRGRGCEHQADVVADFNIHVPFTNPLRMLLESKCLAPGDRAGIEVVRNAVGVLKDVSEFWHVDQHWNPRRNRHHYQYVICSSSGYSEEAQKLAFVQDVNLIQVPPGSALAHLCELIRMIRREDVRRAVNRDGEVLQARRNSRWMINLRMKMREWLRGGGGAPSDLNDFVANFGIFDRLIRRTMAIGECYLTFLGGRFPLLLVPPEGQRLELPRFALTVRIYYKRRDIGAWSIETVEDRVLFTFTMPPVLLEQYLEQGGLAPIRALDLKEELFSKIQILRVENGQPRWYELRLDREWIQVIRESLGRAVEDDATRDEEGET